MNCRNCTLQTISIRRGPGTVHMVHGCAVRPTLVVWSRPMDEKALRLFWPVFVHNKTADLNRYKDHCPPAECICSDWELRHFRERAKSNPQLLAAAMRADNTRKRENDAE